MAVQGLEVVGHCSHLEKVLRNISHEIEHHGLDVEMWPAAMMVSEYLIL